MSSPTSALTENLIEDNELERRVRFLSMSSKTYSLTEIGDPEGLNFVDIIPLEQPWGELFEGTSPSSFILFEPSIEWSTASELQISLHTESQYSLVEIPTGIGKRQEPVIRGKGVPVWVLVSYITKRHLTPQQVSRLWDGYITEQEVRAALAYWRSYPEAVEDKLSDEE